MIAYEAKFYLQIKLSVYFSKKECKISEFGERQRTGESAPLQTLLSHVIQSL